MQNMLLSDKGIMKNDAGKWKAGRGLRGAPEGLRRGLGGA